MWMGVGVIFCVIAKIWAFMYIYVCIVHVLFVLGDLSVPANGSIATKKSDVCVCAFRIMVMRK